MAAARLWLEAHGVEQTRRAMAGALLEVEHRERMDLVAAFVGGIGKTAS